MIIFLILFLAALVQATTSFGFSLVALPLLTMVMPVDRIVPLLVQYSLLINIFLFIKLRRHLAVKLVMVLLAGGVVGLPIGIAILKLVNAALLKKLAGVIIVAITILLYRGYQKKLKHPQKWHFPIGLVSGILQGSLSLSGPPIVFFLANQKADKDYFRANLTSYFLLLNAISLPSMLISGIITTDTVVNSLQYTPAVLLALLAGGFISARISQAHFKRITFALMLLSGLAAIFMG